MSTNSAVIQLQQEALDDTCSVEKLVRLTYTIAMKLEMTEMIEWCNNELSGYHQQKDVPPYRILRGFLKIKLNNGQEKYIPNKLGDINIHENFLDCTIIPLPLARLESLLRNSEKFLDCTYIDPKIEEILRHYIDESFRQHIEKTGDFFLIDKNTKEIVRYMTNYIIVIQIQRNQIPDIFSEVRQYILNWALSLEKAGILGENLIFTKEEQKMSANVTYNIQSVGNMANHNQHSTIQQLSSTVQKGDFNSLKSALEHHGISAEDIQELKEILDKVQQPVNELPAEVDGWLGKIGRTVKDISIQTIVGLITGYILG